MTQQWPPQVKFTTERKVPRRLRTWNFTHDGPFWGGVLAMLIWLSVMGYIAAVVLTYP